MTSWPFWTTGAALALVGLTLTLRALFADKARGRHRCPKCWYDMAGVTPAPDGHTCPECGHYTTERNLTRTRRRWRRAAIGALVLIAGLTAALYPHWSPWLDVDKTPPLLLSVTYPLLGDAAQDKAYERLAELGDFRFRLFSFRVRECKLSHFEMRRLVHIALHRAEDERLSIQQREEALSDLFFIGEPARAVQPHLVRSALDHDNPLDVEAGALALLVSRDKDTVLSTRRRLAERAAPRVALLASAFSINPRELAMLRTGDADVEWEVPQDWSFVAARLERASPDERAAWVDAAAELVAEFEPEEALLQEGIELFQRFDLPTDRLRTEGQP